MKEKPLVPLDNVREEIGVKKIYNRRQNGLNIPMKEQLIIERGGVCR